MAGVPLSLKVAIPDAAELGVGIRTVEHYRNNIAVKLELHGSHALVKFVIQHQAEL